MHFAVDFDNVDDGGVDETNELAKGTGALGGGSVQGPALDEALADDGVHAVGRLSGLTQVLDAEVTEGEEALDVLDGVLQNLSIVEEVLHRENLDQTLLVRCKVRRGSSPAAYPCQCRLSESLTRSPPVPPARGHPETAVPPCPARRSPLIRVTDTDNDPQPASRRGAVGRSVAAGDAARGRYCMARRGGR